MLTIDHVVIFVQDLNGAMDDFRALGFTVNYGGQHADAITENGLVIFGDGTYLELIALVEGRAYEDATFKGLLLENGEGFTGYALLSDDIQAEIAGLRERGNNAADVRAGSRNRPDGQEIRWQMSTLEGGRIPFIIQDETDRNLRVPVEGENIRHSNGVTAIKELLLYATDFDAELARYSTIIGTPLQFGKTARFELGTSAIVITESDAAGYMLILNTNADTAQRHDIHGARIVLI